MQAKASRSAAAGILLEPEVVQQEFVVPPVCLDLDPALQIDPASQKLLAVGPGGAGDLLQHGTAFSDDHSLVAFPLAVDVHIDINQIRAGAFFEALHHDRNAVGNLIPHEKQSLFPG